MSVQERMLYAKEIPGWVTAKDIYNQLHFWCHLDRIQIMERTPSFLPPAGQRGNGGRIRFLLVTFQDVTSADVARRNDVRVKTISGPNEERLTAVIELKPRQPNQNHLIRSARLIEDVEYTAAARGSSPSGSGPGSSSYANVVRINETEKSLRQAKDNYKAKFDEIQVRLEAVRKQREAVTGQKEELMVQVRAHDERLAALDEHNKTLAAEFQSFQANHDTMVKQLQTDLRSFRGLNNNPAAAADFPTLLNSELECPCCLDIKSTEIYQCSAGHLVCKDCLAQLQTCPVCRLPYNQPLSRCLLAEKLAHKLKNK